MNISLTPELDKLVQDKVASGLYNSASEVIREALRLLKEQDLLREARLKELRRDVLIGIEQADRGELIDGQESMSQLREQHKKAL